MLIVSYVTIIVANCRWRGSEDTWVYHCRLIHMAIKTLISTSRDPCKDLEIKAADRRFFAGLLQVGLR